MAPEVLFLFLSFICLLLFTCFAVKRTHVHVRKMRKNSFSKCASSSETRRTAGSPHGPLSLEVKCQSKQLYQSKLEWSKGDDNRLGFPSWENTLLYP